MTQRRRMTLKPRPCRCTRSRQDQVRDDVSSVMTPTRRSVADADTIDESAQGGEDLVGRRRRQRRRVPLSRWAPPTFRLAPPPAFPTRRRSGGAAQCCRGCWTRRLQPALGSKHEIPIDGCHQWLRAKVEIWDETSASPIFRGRATQELRKVCIGVLPKRRSTARG